VCNCAREDFSGIQRPTHPAQNGNRNVKQEKDSQYETERQNKKRSLGEEEEIDWSQLPKTLFRGGGGIV